MKANSPRRSSIIGRPRGVAAGLTALALLATAASAPAQEPAGPPTGQRVRVTARDAGTTVGVLVNVTPESLTVAPDRAGAPVTIRRADVSGVQVSRGAKRHVLYGLLAGAAAWGALVGIVAAADTLDESGVGEPLVIGGLLAAGAGVGSLIRTERWEPAPGLAAPGTAVAAGVVPVRGGAGVRFSVRF